MTLTLNEIPNGKFFEPNPIYRAAQTKAVNERLKHPPKPHTGRTVECPKCGCVFDPDIKLKEVKPR